MRVETRESGGIAGPAKWAAVGALGGAAVMGVIGAMVLRQPRELVAAERSPTPVHAFVTATAPPLPSSTTPVPPPPLPSASPPALVNPQPVEPKPETTKAPPTPEPEPSAPTLPATPPAPVPASEPPKPAPPSPKPAAPAAPKAPAPSGKLNVNRATQAELELLPGIGPAMAKRIIEYRTTHGAFKRIDDLDKVKGIGPKTLEKLRPLVTIE